MNQYNYTHLETPWTTPAKESGLISLKSLLTAPARIALAIVGMSLLNAPGLAQEAEQSPSREFFDRAWSHARLYDNPDSRFLKQLSLSGRLQFDSAWFDADQGDYNDILWRRFRFGFAAKFAGSWKANLEADLDLNEELSDAYNRLTDAYIGYTPGETWGVKILKQSAGFTLDGATSSKKLLTLQRNNVTNNLWFTAEYFTGISIAGEIKDRWGYKAGIFSADPSDEISVSEGGVFGLFSLAYEFGSDLELDKAFVRLEYVANEEDPESNTRDFAQVLSVVSQWEKWGMGLWTDLSFGDGYLEQSDVWGLSLMPFYDFNSHHQLVLRYTFLDSDGDNGLRLGRYEREIVEGRGNRYNEIYLGYNLFFYGHKLKWQTGLQYTDMEDDANDGGEYQGWGLTTGVRLSWP